MKDKITKRKILTDRNFPTSEQINRHQNFDRLQKDHSLIKKIMMKKIILWSGAVVCMAGVAGLILLKTTAADTVPAKADNSTATVAESAIQPPLPGKETPFVTYRISAKNGGVIHYPTGSSVTIPVNAFLSPQGAALSDSIDIKYREFHDPLAIFLSGIPMHYDSAGVANTLESAGMIEILAFDKGKALQLNAQTPIDIKMASKNSDGRFNLYELDTLHNNWVYKGKDKVEKITEPKTFHKVRHMDEAQALAGPSVKPALADPQGYSFKINYNKVDFPELEAYDNVVFEVTDNSFKPAYYRINWNKISLYAGTELGQYIVKLKKADTSISVTAKPVFNKADYAKALAKFEERHKASAGARDQKEFENQAALNQANKSLATYATRNSTVTAVDLVGITSYRAFSIQSTGFFNCDFPIPPVMQYAYSFKKVVEQRKQTTDPKQVAYSTIFLIEKGKNTVFRFAKGEPVRCNPNAKNLMWTITDKNDIAFFRITDYSKLANGAENNIRPVIAKSQDLAFTEIRKFSE